MNGKNQEFKTNTHTHTNYIDIPHVSIYGKNCDRGSNKGIAKHADDKQIYSIERPIKTTLNCVTNNANMTHKRNQR